MALITTVWTFQIETSMNESIKPRINKMSSQIEPS